MKKTNIVSLMLLVLSFNTLSAQNTQKIIFCCENSSAQYQFVSANGLDKIYMIGLNDALLDYDALALERVLNTTIPDKNQSGYAFLDWEGEYFVALKHPTNTLKLTHDQIVNRFIFAIQNAKKLRPNIKWTYYGMPLSWALGVPANWKEINYALYKELDFLAPSVYLRYEREIGGERVEGLDTKFTTNFMVNNLKYSLKLGVELNKPVYAFIWMRYSEDYYNKLIDLASFTKYVRSIITTSNYGRKADGIIWWNCINFLYERRATCASSVVLLEEFKNVTDINAYQTTLFQKYLDSIKPMFNYYK